MKVVIELARSVIQVARVVIAIGDETESSELQEIAHELYDATLQDKLRVQWDNTDDAPEEDYPEVRVTTDEHERPKYKVEDVDDTYSFVELATGRRF